MADLFMKYKLPDSIIVNVIFVGRRKMRETARAYKNEDIALPVLSFRYNETSPEKEPLLGEIVLCYPQVILLAAERNRKVNDTVASLLEHGLQNLFKE